MTEAAASAVELNAINATTTVQVTLDSDGDGGDAITSVESSAYADV